MIITIGGKGGITKHRAILNANQIRNMARGMLEAKAVENVGAESNRDSSPNRKPVRRGLKAITAGMRRRIIGSGMEEVHRGRIPGSLLRGHKVELQVKERNLKEDHMTVHKEAAVHQIIQDKGLREEVAAAREIPEGAAQPEANCQ
jgi:hypothetical protein